MLPKVPDGYVLLAVPAGDVGAFTSPPEEKDKKAKRASDATLPQPQVPVLPPPRAKSKKAARADFTDALPVQPNLNEQARAQAPPESAFVVGEAPKRVALRIAELAALGPISKPEIYRRIKNGELRVRKLGRTTYVLFDDWLSFLRAQPAGTNKDHNNVEVGRRKAREAAAAE